MHIEHRRGLDRFKQQRGIRARPELALWTNHQFEIDSCLLYIASPVVVVGFSRMKFSERGAAR